MKINIQQQGDDYLRLQILDDPHTLYNMLKEKCLERDDVLLCGYARDQTFENSLIFQIKTEKGTNPVDVLIDSSRELIKTTQEFRRAFDEAYPE